MGPASCWLFPESLYVPCSLLFLQSPVECVSPISKAWSLSFTSWLSPLSLQGAPLLYRPSLKEPADHSALASTVPALQCSLRKTDSEEEFRDRMFIRKASWDQPLWKREQNVWVEGQVSLDASPTTHPWGVGKALELS